MKIWKNTNTIDKYIDGFETTEDKNEAEIAILGSKKIELSQFPVLKGIFRCGVGKDNIPIEEASGRGIAVGFPSLSTIDIIYDETASFTCSAIFRMLYNDIGSLKPWVKIERRTCKDKNLLIIGSGNIGSRVKYLMERFLKVTVYDKLNNNEAQLKELMSVADVVTLHIPYNKENHELIDREKLSWLKDEAILINTSRGAIVSEEALYEEIKSGRIRAAFDVYWIEPYEGILKQFHPERFYMTPHVASTCSTFVQETAKDFKAFIKEL